MGFLTYSLEPEAYMSIFQSIRFNPPFNEMIRRLIVFLKRLLDKLEKKWRLSGEIPLTVNDIEFKMYTKCDDGIIEPLFYDQSYIEYSDLEVFTHLLKSRGVVFDIGANTGIYSIMSAKKDHAATIYSFEPNPVNLNRLKHNIALNSLSNVRIIPLAVGSESKSISFTVPTTNIISDTSSARESFSKETYKGSVQWRSIAVEQTSIDVFCADNAIQTLDLMKIDVEGYEVEVLQGALKTLRKHRPTILLETFSDSTEKMRIKEIIDEIGYNVYLIFPKGIVRVDSIFEPNPGLNYLLCSHRSKHIYTPMNQLERQFRT